MSLYYAGGLLYNLLGRGPNAVTLNGTADANFPIANLYAGRPRKPFAYSAKTTDHRVIVDGQLVTQGGFEEATLADWTDQDTGTGVSSRDTAVKNSGSASLKLVPGASGSAQRNQVVTVRSGERLKIRAYIRQDGAGAAGLRVYNQYTANFLQTDGTWDPGAGDNLSNVKTSADTSAVFSLKEQTFTVESRADCGGQNTVTLLVWPYCDDNLTAAYIDDVELFPAINFLGVFSHNIYPQITPTWRSDDADSAFGSAVTRGTPTIAQPNFYSYLSTAIYARYWDLLLSGFPLEIPRIGELVMCYVETLGKAQRQGWGDGYELPQERVDTPEGDEHVAVRGTYPIRTLSLPFVHTTLALRDEMRDEILDRAGYGQRETIVVPKDDEPDVVFARAAAEWGITRVFNAKYLTSTLVLREYPHMEWIDG